MILPPANYLTQASAPHAGKAVFANDDVIMDGYAELSSRLGDVARHDNILPAGRAVATWMAVNQYDSRRAISARR